MAEVPTADLLGLDPLLGSQPQTLWAPTPLNRPLPLPPTLSDWEVLGDGERRDIPVQTETSRWFKGRVLPVLGDGAVELLKASVQYGGRYLRGELDEPEDPPRKRPKGPIPILDDSATAERTREMMEAIRQTKVAQELRQAAAKEANLTAKTSIQMWLNENRVTLVLAAAALLLLYLLRSNSGGGGSDLPNFPNLPGPNFGKRRYYYA